MPSKENPPELPNQIKLWNPNAAVNWSILFTPAFGALIHAQNAKALGRKLEHKINLIWAVVSLSLYGYNVHAMKTHQQPMIGTTLLVLFVWYFVTAKKQVAFISENYGSSYQRKGWLKPIGCVLAALFAFGFISGVINAINHPRA